MPDNTEIYSYPGEQPDPRVVSIETRHLWDPKVESGKRKFSEVDYLTSGNIEIVEKQVSALLNLVETNQKEKDILFEETLKSFVNRFEDSMNTFSQRLVTALGGYPQPINPYTHPSQNTFSGANENGAKDISESFQGLPDPRFNLGTQRLNLSDPLVSSGKPEEQPSINNPSFWASLLNKAAQVELTGGILYRFYAGLLAEPQYVKLFQDFSEESFRHYDKVQELILSLGMKEYLALYPDMTMLEIKPIPPILKDLVPSVFAWMAKHEAMAIDAYKDLGSAVSGQDWALENFALTQVEEETRHYVQLLKLSGIL